MNRAGEYIKVNLGEASYNAYRPAPLPPCPNLVIDEAMLDAISHASHSIGELDAVSELVPDVKLFLGAYVRKEALLSSQIEGTQATLEDILDAGNDIAVNAEVDEVVNYVKALGYAVERMKTLPLGCRLLKETHEVLMSGVRGEDKSPGEFRRSQNWIGAAGSTIATAKYVPPTVDEMNIAMSDLEKYINMSEDDTLLKTALAHYQFETIHPFLDGNGRIGRMLIVLMLLQGGVLRTPTLYMSLYLKRNRVEYYDRLSEVRRRGDYEQWVKFFLNGVDETARDCSAAIRKLSALLATDGAKLASQPQSVKNVFELLKSEPIVTAKHVTEKLGLSYATASAALSALEAQGVVRRANDARRNRVFEYGNYIDILKSGT